MKDMEEQYKKIFSAKIPYLILLYFMEYYSIYSFLGGLSTSYPGPQLDRMN